MYLDMDWRLDSLLGGQRYLRQRLRADERERDDTRDREKNLIR